MKDRTQYIEELDINFPFKEGYIKELIGFAKNQSCDDRGVLVADTIAGHCSYFTRDKVFVLNGLAFKKKNRIKIIESSLILDVVSDKTGYLYLYTLQERICIGIFRETDIKNIKDKLIALVDKNKKESIHEAIIQYDLKKCVMTKKLTHARAILEVKWDSWLIKYTFSSYDMRYNYRYLVIKENEVERYIKEWKEAFDIYFLNKSKIKGNKTFSTTTSQGIHIDVNTLHDGVYLHPWQIPFRTRKEFDGILKDYSEAHLLVEKLRREMKKIVDVKKE